MRITTPPSLPLHAPIGALEVVRLSLPEVGRVLALRTGKRDMTAVYLLADGDADCYLHDIQEDGTPSAAYAVEELGTSDDWMRHPDQVPAVGAVVAWLAGEQQKLGPVTLTRAIDLAARQGCPAAEAIAQARRTTREIAASEHHLGRQLDALMAA